jgi:hypothetical protein
MERFNRKKVNGVEAEEQCRGEICGMMAYLLSDRAIGTGGGHFVATYMHGNIDGDVNAFVTCGYVFTTMIMILSCRGR